MATSSDFPATSDLNCPLCYKMFIVPRILPCLHTFCETCLSRHIESSVQDGSKFTCPICTTSTVPPDINLTVNKWASTFPVDCVIQTLLKKPDTDDKLCDICKLDNESTIAEFWCIDCQEKLCAPCNRDHKRIKVSRHHTTVPSDEIKSKPMTLKMDFDQGCVRHPGKKQDVVCIDHRELCCLVCFSENHRQCSDIRDIDDGADQQTKQFSMKNIVENMRQMTSGIDIIVNSKSDSVQQLANEKEKIVNDMDAMVDRAIRKLNDLRNTFKYEAEQIHSEKKESLMRNDVKVQRFKTNVANANYILRELEKHGSVRQKFVVFENILSQISSHYRQLVSDLQDDKEMHLKLVPNNLIRDIEATLNAVGNIDVSSKPLKALKTNLTNIDKQLKTLKSRTQLKSTMRAAQVEKVDFMTSSVTFVKAVTRQETGKNTWISGCAVLNDGRLIMADYNNNRLIQINDKYSIEREYKIDGCPTDVAAGNNNNELYIGLAVGYSSVYRCTLDTDLNVINKITVPIDTVGIAVCSDYIIASTASEVVILTHDGSKVRSFSKSGTDTYVAVSPTSRTLYHEDSDAIVCRAYDGNEKFRYEHQQLKKPRGICLDVDNNIYVCGCDSGNLHQISPDGQGSKIILNKLRNISHPWSIILISQRNEIIVSSGNENTVFEVYRFSE